MSNPEHLAKLKEGRDVESVGHLNLHYSGPQRGGPGRGGSNRGGPQQSKLSGRTSARRTSHGRPQRGVPHGGPPARRNSLAYLICAGFRPRPTSSKAKLNMANLSRANVSRANPQRRGPQRATPTRRTPARRSSPAKPQLTDLSSGLSGASLRAVWLE
jgi:hypothetical protein